MQHFAISAVIALATTLAACGGDDAPAPRAPVARNFDELAEAIAGCADMLRDCRGDDAGLSSALACRDEFIQCRSRAGKSAEDALVKEISDCQAHANDCRADASTDKTETRCAQTLRACIGEARSDGNGDSSRDAGFPNSNAPTYQCFGQLRECVTDSGSPQTCAGEARVCVIAAVGDPPAIRRPPVVPPSDAGVRNPQTGGAAGSDAGTGGAASPDAGKRGSGVPNAGAGGSGAAGGGDDTTGDDTAQRCMAEHEACLMRGEKPMTCAKDQRKCLKDGV